MMFMQFILAGATRLQSRFQRAAAKSTDVQRQALDRGLRILDRRVIKKVSGEVLKRREGSAGLAGSFSHEISEIPGGWQGIYGTKHPGAALHEFGGVIEPVDAPMLVFEHPHRSGNIVVTDRVDMPARPYLRPAYQETKGDIEKQLRDAWDKLLRGL